MFKARNMSAVINQCFKSKHYLKTETVAIAVQCKVVKDTLEN